MSVNISSRWSPTDYATNAAFVPALGSAALELLAPQPGEMVLDLGCGDGVLTQKIMAVGARAIGLDASPEMVEAARCRGVDAFVADVQALDLEHQELRFGHFDACFSNAALHWMLDPDAVAAGVFSVLKPGGRFVGEMGGQGNVTKVLTAAVGALDRRGIDGRAAVPWYFPGVEEYRSKLEARGFRVRNIELFPRPTRIPGEIAAWLETFGEAFINRVPPAARSAYLAEVSSLLGPDLRDAEGWFVDYVRLRFAAEKPA